MNIFDVIADEEEYRKGARLSHLIGDKDEDVSFLPAIVNGFQKDARRHFTEREKLALIEENGEAANVHRLNIKGTHYENQTAAEIAMSIMPLKGL